MYYLIVGIIFLISGIIALFLPPEFFYELSESWKSLPMGEPSDLYKVSVKVGAFINIMIGIVCIVVFFWSFGNDNNNTIADSEAESENIISYTKDIDSYYAKDGDIEKLVANLDEDDIFEIGKNIIITNDEVAQYEEFYSIVEEDALAKAQEYARERNALYVAAIENGFTVSDQDINNYLKEMKEEINSSRSADQDLYAYIGTEDEYCVFEIAYIGTEDEYWAFEFEVYKMDLPIQNYAKSLESQYKADNASISDDLELDQMWTEEYENIKQELVEEQNFLSPGTYAENGIQ